MPTQHSLFPARRRHAAFAAQGLILSTGRSVDCKSYKLASSRFILGQALGEAAGRRTFCALHRAPVRAANIPRRGSIKPLNVLILIAAVLVIAFAILNRDTLGTQVAVSFGFTRVSVSLGALLLVLALLLGGAFAALLVGVQFRHLSLHRRHSDELRSHRELADNAESSRFTELRQYLQQELAQIKELQRQSEQRLRDEMQDTQNSLSASMGEIDERLERQFPSRPEQQP
jgi:hypothetical protein